MAATKRKPKVFVGSSKEQLAIANEIQRKLELDNEAEVTIWTDNIFDLSTSTLEALEKALKSVHFGVFILAPDDRFKIRGKNYAGPRDNVIFELGLFAGKLGYRRTFILQPKGQDLRLPTDLLGITTADYDVDRAKNDVAGALGNACLKISQAIKNIFDKTFDLAWDELPEKVRELKKRLQKNQFAPNILLGISRGGVIIADLLSQEYGDSVPMISLWGNRTGWKDKPRVDFENEINEPLKELISTEKYKSLLIVDNISRTGTALRKAKKFVLSNAKRKTIKTAVLVAVENIPQNDFPDYYVQTTSYTEFKMPDFS
jgi:hypoxanthine phosphoribosyltransferase